MLPHFAPSQKLKKTNYVQVLPIVMQADQGSAKNATINTAISMTKLSAVRKPALGSFSLTPNFVQTDEAKFKG